MDRTRSRIHTGRAYQSAAVLLFTAFCAAFLMQSLSMTGGQLVYSLDDPAIHMELSRSILLGEYGVNPGEYASPSSSILFPFLLAGAFALGLGDWGPFVLNFVAGIIAIWMIAGFVWDRSRAEASDFGVGMVWALLIPWVILTFAVGLVFAGMEHGLHLLAAVAVVIGLARLEPEDRTPIWLCAAIIAAPLLRFEGFAMATLALIALVVLGRGRAAVFTLAVLAAAVAVYGAVMSSLGLPVIPSSVLAKSHVTTALIDGDGSVSRALTRVSKNFAFYEGMVLFAGLVVMLGATLAFARTRRDIAVAVVVMGTAAAHLVLGRVDVWSRYEAYAISALFCGLVFLLAGPIARRGSAALVGLAILAMLGAGLKIAARTWLTPGGVTSIYAQQVQMGRFASDIFPEPVAINDLGYVTYQNDTFVLDLMGLSSEPMREIRRNGNAPEAIEALAQERDVVYAMVYDHWFDALPASWCRVAILTSPHLTASGAEVSFYIVDPEREDDLRAAIDEFAPTLPPMASIAQEPACG